MKLFEYLKKHIGPKSSATYVEEYLIADTEQQVFDYVDEQAGWKDEREAYAEYPEEYETPPMSAEEMMEIRGDLNDPDVDLSDTFYGVRLHGWNEGVDITPEDAEVLLRLGLAKDIR